MPEVFFMLADMAPDALLYAGRRKTAYIKVSPFFKLNRAQAANANRAVLFQYKRNNIGLFFYFIHLQIFAQDSPR